MLSEHYKQQPRIPAGNKCGGQWIKGNSNSQNTTNNSDNNPLFYGAMLSNNPKFVSIEKEALSYVGNKKIARERKSGIKDEILAEIIVVKGWDGTPKKLSDNELCCSIKSKHGIFVYRCLPNEVYKEAFYDGELWVGQGIFGNGIYMAYGAIDAIGYGNHIAVAVMDSDMHFAPYENRVEHKKFLNYLNEKITNIQNYGTVENLQNYECLYNMMCDYGKYAALSGYDAYKAGKNIVVLNRSKLKIGETNEKLERIAL